MQEDGKVTRDNLEICPNCLEPNISDLANCAFCGMPLHAVQPDPAELAGEPAAADSVDTNAQNPAKPADGSSKKEGGLNKGFTYAMRGMGLYLIITGITEIPRMLKLEDTKNRNIGILSNVIYIIAGGLMAWPLLKEWLDKRKPKPEETEPAAEEQAEPSDEITALEENESKSEAGLPDSAVDTTNVEPLPEVQIEASDDSSPVEEPDSKSDEILPDAPAEAADSADDPMMQN